MNPETTDRFERLETLRSAAWDSFNSRRAYEWKINLSLWAMLAAFIAALASEKISINLSSHLRTTLAVIPALLGCAHVAWLRGLHRAYRLDKLEEGEFRKAMREEIKFVETDEITKIREKIIAGHRRGLNWNHVPQLMTTAVLVVLSVLVVFARP